MRTITTLCVLAGVCRAQGPAPRPWVMAAFTNAAVQAIAPEVHTVRSDDSFIYIESAGLSLHSFGPLEANQYDAPLGPRAFSFRIPKNPRPDSRHLSVPLGIIGVFATGVPICNPLGAISWRDQNIWHQDAVAASKVRTSSLLMALLAGAGRHSPIIGFALDGYPIYGPFGWNAAGEIQRMRSSYRLRRISGRDTLPDGTVLTPAQEGPRIGSEFPLGTFAEDYEYAAGSGDLDEFNGSYVRTPEYPEGTYAYFLTTANTGAIAWPYLIGPRYFGDAPLDVPARVSVQHSKMADLWSDRVSIEAGKAARLTLVFHDPLGRTIRFLEKVHRQPVHLIVVSKDLAEFEHIHPEPTPDDSLSIIHVFPHPGEYWLYADYTAPGETPSIARFSIKVAGQPRSPVQLLPDTKLTKTVDGIRIAIAPPPHWKAGADLPLAFTLTDAETGQPIADLDPWLGAWGHIMIVGASGESFIHAHPLEGALTEIGFLPHVHAPPVPGPSPSVIRTVTGFRSAGVYKLWFQCQRHGRVITASWVANVSKPDRPASVPVAQPSDVIRVTVSSAGFEPSRLQIRAGQSTRIAFRRSDAQNCASEVVFPGLGLRKRLPPGETVIVDLPAQSPGEMRFACGMGMYRGAVVVR